MKICNTIVIQDDFATFVTFGIMICIEIYTWVGAPLGSLRGEGPSYISQAEHSYMEKKNSNFNLVLIILYLA